MKSRLFYFIFSFFLFDEISAQTPLSLSDAIEIALANNYGVRIQKINADIAKSNNNFAEAGKLPRITLFANQTNLARNNKDVSSLLQGTILNNNINPGIQLDWTLFSGNRVNIQKDKLDLLQQQSEGNAIIVIENTLQTVILGYYRALVAQQSIQRYKEQLALSSDRYRHTKVKNEIGAATSSETLYELTNYLTDSAALITQEVTYRETIRDLNLVLAVENPNTQYTLTDTFEIIADNYQYEDLLNKIENNSNLKTQYLSQALLKEEFELRRAELMPTVNMQAIYSYDLNRRDISNATFIDGRSTNLTVISAYSNTASVNFSLSYNLFNGGKVKRAIKNVARQLDVAGLQTEQMKNSLTNDLASEFDMFNVRRQLANLATLRRQTALQNLEVVKDRFKMGVISSFDFRIIQNQLLAAELDELNALYNLKASHTNLLRLTGGILTENNK
jgi:outer membrane protein TolC